jgi:hypothetical protein
MNKGEWGVGLSGALPRPFFYKIDLSYSPEIVSVNFFPVLF